MFTMLGSLDAMRYMNAQRKIEGRPFYILHPHSTGVALWDVVTTIALLFTAAVTPFEVAYLDSGVNAIFWVNRAVDIIFVTDMVLQFFIMQQVDQKKGADIDSFWEYRLSKLARRYFRTWFWIDFFSIVPSLFDILPAMDVQLFGGDDGGNTESFSALRVIRVARLAKLVRLLRSSRVIERWEARIAIPYNEVTIFTLFAAILYMTHVFACILALPTSFGPKVNSWFGTYGYCDAREFELPLSNENATSVPCAPVSQLYLQSLYWALGIILGFTNSPMRGPFPDPHEATLDPAERFTELRTHEQILYLILQFCGAILWAYVTARLVDVIVNASPETTRFRQNMDELNRFCAFNKLPKEMEIRLREYYMKRKQITSAESRQQVAERLSPMLQGEVAWHVNAAWLSRIPFLNHDVLEGAEPSPAMQHLRVKVALTLRPNVFAPSESPPDGHLYVIFNGLARYRGSTLTKGDHWGEWDVLLQSAIIRRNRATAINYLHVLMIDAGTIHLIAEEYPEAYRHIRRWIGWRSLSAYLLDKLRRRRRNMTLLVKRWARRYPNLFAKMRIFVMAVYYLLKASENAPDKHRGRLTTRRTAINVADGADDATRFAIVSEQIKTLLEEQMRLAGSMARRSLGPRPLANAISSQAPHHHTSLPGMQPPDAQRSKLPPISGAAAGLSRDLRAASAADLL